MYNVHITTDRTDANGDDVVHSIKADRDQVDNLTNALNAGIDYVGITDVYGALHHVRKMDIHAVSIRQGN